ncbi:hypothetical protein LZ32DRAFT_157033 [Colletotrichum eremochloae]|nr:hypothetical protein LZ32DRAFT_157033 [Colletotrichum eremochloae]
MRGQRAAGSPLPTYLISTRAPMNIPPYLLYSFKPGSRPCKVAKERTKEALHSNKPRQFGSWLSACRVTGHPFFSLFARRSCPTTTSLPFLLGCPLHLRCHSSPSPRAGSTRLDSSRRHSFQGLPCLVGSSFLPAFVSCRVKLAIPAPSSGCDQSVRCATLHHRAICDGGVSPFFPRVLLPSLCLCLRLKSKNQATNAI